jgi:hypothetical protein
MTQVSQLRVVPNDFVTDNTLGATSSQDGKKIQVEANLTITIPLLIAEVGSVYEVNPLRNKSGEKKDIPDQTQSKSGTSRKEMTPKDPYAQLAIPSMSRTVEVSRSAIVNVLHAEGREDFELDRQRWMPFEDIGNRNVVSSSNAHWTEIPGRDLIYDQPNNSDDQQTAVSRYATIVVTTDVSLSALYNYPDVHISKNGILTPYASGDYMRLMLGLDLLVVVKSEHSIVRYRIPNVKPGHPFQLKQADLILGWGPAAGIGSQGVVAEC